MPDRAALLTALGPILDALAEVDPADPTLAAALNRRLPVDGEALSAVASLVRAGAEAG